MIDNTRNNGRVDYCDALHDTGSGENAKLAAEARTPGTCFTARPIVGRTRLAEIRFGLAGRDLALLRVLATFRLATTDQLRRYLFAGYSSDSSAAWTCRATLRKLVSFKLVDHLTRRVGGRRAGSASYVWRLRAPGWRVLDDSEPRPPQTFRKEPSLFTTDHTLAITEVAVQLHEAEHAGTIDVIECTPEPASWRTYLNAGGGLVTLKPDLFAVTAAKNAEYEDVWFVEVDRATESLPTIRRKAAQYDRYRATGKEQATQGVFPKVVWLTPDATRADQITTTLAGVNGGSHASHLAMPLGDFAGFVSTPEQKGDAYEQ